MERLSPSDSLSLHQRRGIAFLAPVFLTEILAPKGILLLFSDPHVELDEPTAASRNPPHNGRSEQIRNAHGQPLP